MRDLPPTTDDDNLLMRSHAYISGSA